MNSLYAKKREPSNLSRQLQIPRDSHIATDFTKLYPLLLSFRDIIVEKVLKEKAIELGEKKTFITSKPVHALVTCELTPIYGILCYIDIPTPRRLFTLRITIDRKQRLYFDPGYLFRAYLYNFSPHPILAVYRPAEFIKLDPNILSLHACINVCMSSKLSEYDCMIFSNKAIVNLGDLVAYVTIDHMYKWLTVVVGGKITLYISEKYDEQIDDRLSDVKAREAGFASEIKEILKSIFTRKRINDPKKVALLYIALNSLVSRKIRRPCKHISVKRVLKECIQRCKG